MGSTNFTLLNLESYITAKHHLIYSTFTQRDLHIVMQHPVRILLARHLQWRSTCAQIQSSETSITVAFSFKFLGNWHKELLPQCIHPLISWLEKLPYRWCRSLILKHRVHLHNQHKNPADTLGNKDAASNLPLHHIHICLSSSVWNLKANIQHVSPYSFLKLDLINNIYTLIDSKELYKLKTLLF